MSKFEKFLNLHPKKSSNTYRSGIFKFLEVTYDVKRAGRRTTAKEREYFQQLAEQYLTEKRDYNEDLMNFAVSFRDSPPKTAKTYFIAVKEYLEYLGIEFKKRELKNIKSKLPKGSRARTVEMDMDNTIIRQLMEHMSVNGKALILTLASSGMRIGEALQIDLDDVNLDANPPTIIIRGAITKNGNNRITFINREAKQTLEEWLKVRDKYLKSSLNKNVGLVNRGIGNLKDENDSRLFPFSYDNVKEIWDNVLKKTGYDKVDKSTGRKQLRIHQLRKFFRSQLALGCPVDIVEALMGHEGYLTDAYRRYTNKQMGEYYLKYEHLLYISMPEDILKLKSEFTDELNNTKDALCHNRSQVETLIAENNAYRDRLDNVEAILDTIVNAVKQGRSPDNIFFDENKGKIVLHK